MLIGKILVLAVLVVGVLLGINYLANSIAIGPATVLDGDSLQIGDKLLTLDGVDAVELDQTCTFNSKQWPCGKHAAAALQKLTAGKTVTCRPNGSLKGERRIARCFVGTDFDLGRSQVQSGWAVSVPTSSANYTPDEKAAQKSLSGIWSSFFELPWRFVNPRKDVIP